MTRYASNTSVAVSVSKHEIERTLERYGAGAFGYYIEPKRATIGFEVYGRRVRITLPLPDRSEFTRTETGRSRTTSSVSAAHEQACRQRWRALALVIKAKLEAVESGISTFEEEFLAHILLPNGSTVGDWATPQIAAAYKDGAMPKMLSGIESC